MLGHTVHIYTPREGIEGMPNMSPISCKLSIKRIFNWLVFSGCVPIAREAASINHTLLGIECSSHDTMIKVKGTGMSINWILAQSTQTVPIILYYILAQFAVWYANLDQLLRSTIPKYQNNVIFDRLLVHASATTPDMVHTIVAWLESTSWHSRPSRLIISYLNICSDYSINMSIQHRDTMIIIGHFSWSKIMQWFCCDCFFLMHFSATVNSMWKSTGETFPRLWTVFNL